MAIEEGINLDDVAGKEEVLSPGMHGAVVVSNSVELSKAKNKMVVFRCKAIDGPDAGKDMIVRLSLQPNALWKLRTFRDACKVQTGPNLDTDLFNGAKFKTSNQPREMSSDDGLSVRQVNDFTDFFPYEG